MKQASPRTSQQPKTNAHAFVARSSEVVRGLNSKHADWLDPYAVGGNGAPAKESKKPAKAKA